MQVITLAYREQGLILQPGNPKSIHTIADLARPEVTFINRNSGSGTRLWLDRQMHSLGILAENIRGYENYRQTHTESARYVQPRGGECNDWLACRYLNLVWISFPLPGTLRSGHPGDSTFSCDALA